MSMKTSHKTRRTCTAADGTTIPKGASVDLTADEVILWVQDGKIAKPVASGAAGDSTASAAKK